LIGGAFDHADHRGAAVRAGGDVEENHFVRALFVVAEREFDGIADVAEFAGFGFAELDAARDFAIVDVKAGNDTFCEHENIEAAVTPQGKMILLRKMVVPAV